MRGQTDILTPKIKECLKELKTKKKATVANGRRFSAHHTIARIHWHASQVGIKVKCLDVGWMVLVTKV